MKSDWLKDCLEQPITLDTPLGFRPSWAPGYIHLLSLTPIILSYLLFLTTDHLYSTVGVHPTYCSQFDQTTGIDPEQYLDQLLALVTSNRGKVVAIGECGLGVSQL